MRRITPGSILNLAAAYNGLHVAIAIVGDKLYGLYSSELHVSGEFMYEFDELILVM